MSPLFEVKLSKYRDSYEIRVTTYRLNHLRLQHFSL